MKRPKRENYPNGIYGDISYNDRLERYTSYLENKLKECDNETQDECWFQIVNTVEDCIFEPTWDGVIELLKEQFIVTPRSPQ
jgi:hypothetical protein